MNKTDVYRSNGIQSFCTEGCFLGNMSKNAERKIQDSNPKRSKRTKPPDIPPEIRQKVIARDKGCRYCGNRLGLHAHHIVYRSQGGKHTLDNLITLCYVHHDLIHSDKKRFMPLCQLAVVEPGLIPSLEKKYGNGIGYM